MSLILSFLLANGCANKQDSVDPANKIPNSAIETTNQSTNNYTSKSATSSGSCISPTDTFSYSIVPSGDDRNKLAVLPSNPWQVDQPLEDIMDTTRYSSILTTRFYNSNIEIWMTGFPVSGITNGDQHNQLFIYRPGDKTWKSISAKIEGTDLYVTNLFVTQDGAVWGQVAPSGYDDTKVDFVLSKYNEKTELFEFDNNTQGIPVSWKYSDGLVIPSKILLNSQRSTFWILVPEDGVYSYSVASKESKSYTKFPETDKTDMVAEPVFSPDGNIYYLTVGPNVLTNDDVSLYRFIPATADIERISMHLEPWPVVSSVFADQEGRLWFGGIGWRETNGNWYQILRSPIFITNSLWSGMDYRWKSPNILMESSDNRLWFESENGMVWLDPSDGKWCWFTTVQSNIVEDEEHNLWMIADTKLYKYSLNP